MKPVLHFWSYSIDKLLVALDTNVDGLSESQVLLRLKQQKHKEKNVPSWKKDALLFLSQYTNPLVLLLFVAVILSLILGEYSDSGVIIVVLLLAGIFSFAQERKAGKAVEKLQALINTKATVKRENKLIEINIGDIVPGDIIMLRAGDVVPADAMLVEANDLHVNQSALTGESFPAEKFVGVCKDNTSLTEVTNSVFKGTSVINGTAAALAVNAGDDTEVGKIASQLSKSTQETAFEKGIRQFGYMLMRLTLIISLLVLTLNILFDKPAVDSLLFALALAIGITPELLPAIVTVTLAAGAKRMADKKVIVKKLNAIQNLGEMDVLCSDKTGTLTEGVVEVSATIGVNGEHSEKIKAFAYYNAFYETGFSNPIDQAIRGMTGVNMEGYSKRDEVPYDFIRKRLSIVVENSGRHIMITKGAVKNVLECCAKAELANGSAVAIDNVKNDCGQLLTRLSGKGLRTIAIAYKDVTGDPIINKDDETDMTLLGYICFTDPLKKGIIESIKNLQQKGVSLILITGDNQLVAKHVAEQIGLPANELLSGADLQQLTSEALQQKVTTTRVFAEIEPMQKERIVRALQKNGGVVGFLGDGINDANALKTADVGISVDSAVDVAKEAAAFVLMERNLDVILDGIQEGRKTFMNTLKYIFVTTSANFGNMMSMAVFSLVIPFLPLLPIQVLLNNFLSDIPALAIASDKVDKEFLEKPRRWDMKYIRRFMVVFGLQSSVFDFLTFAVLLYILHVSPAIFRTGWFLESVLTQIFILLVIRTRYPLIKSRPSNYLLITTASIFCLVIILPYLPVATLFELYPLPLKLFSIVLGIAILYAVTSDVTKRKLFKSWMV